MIPCLNKEALKLLTGTADERYEVSPDYFRSTHFPQVMHRYQGNQLLAEVTENELFEELIESDTRGNRIYFVFGSTGSGKSELLCWIRDKWLLERMDRPVIRISRSELNPQVLIKKCFDTIGIPLSIPIDENRWELLLKKPITLINQMVWTTLAEALPTDEEIVPLALLVRPIIEKNVTEFTLQVQRGHIKKPLEVLHPDQFDELMASTSLSMPLEYLSFRQALSHKLDQFLFEGYDIGALFKLLSEQLKMRNIRPLLLIDDLVQSVNIYATELLDQLITLEEGNWDVVIGLTPGAIQDSDKGFHLTQRIQNLDTIADRVKKLWLSDESGKDFYNLDRSQVVAYMSNYLVELKATQGFICSKACHHYWDCIRIARSSVETEEEQMNQDVNLLPFNRTMIKRTFDAIPLGKGKLRYMILHSKEIIRFFQKGKREWTSRMLPLVKREKFAEHEDLLIKTLAEWYVSEEQDEGLVPREVLKHFGYQSGDVTVRLHSLEGESAYTLSSIGVDEHPQVDSEKGSVREWVEGQQTNIELLEPVRSGVAAFVHDIVRGVNVSRAFTPKASATIQRKEIVNRTRYPIVLDDSETSRFGIRINKGVAALQISNFQILNAQAKARVLQKISGEYETASWVYQTEDLRSNWRDILEKELMIPVETFAFQLKHWVERCLLIVNGGWTEGIKSRSPFTKETIDLVEQVYQDWFMLRDNMFEPINPDLPKQIDFDEWIRSYTPSKELEYYQIGDLSLYAFLVRLKGDYYAYLTLLHGRLRQLAQERITMVPFLLESSDSAYQTFAEAIKQFEKSDYVLQDYLNYTALEEELSTSNVVDQFRTEALLYSEVESLNRQYHAMCQTTKTHFLELGGEGSSRLPTHTPTWSNLRAEKESLLVLIDALTKLNYCLSVTPQRAWEQIQQSAFESDDIMQVKAIWLRLAEHANDLLDRHPVRGDFVHSVSAWQAVDFHGLRRQVEKMNIREAKKQHVIKYLQKDLKCNQTNDLTDILNIIETSAELRPAIKRQLKALLEQGYSKLPPVQWKRLLDELQEKFPSLFDIIEIRLVASDTCKENSLDYLKPVRKGILY
ncbi:hypothetical protein KB559_13505 [Paenibacillus sp. Marseille-P2973]|nr:hypothetical protein [Paenibacillus sp. Marseille-P2973]